MTHNPLSDILSWKVFRPFLWVTVAHSYALLCNEQSECVLKNNLNAKVNSFNELALQSLEYMSIS